jgi:hypothetical protein
MAKKETDTTESPNDAIAAALLKIAEMAQQPRDGGLSAEQLAQILEGNAQATRKALRPENERHPDVSAFNPKGERDNPRPKLVHKVLFCGMELDEEELTLGEIELFNKFSHSCIARNGSWRADVKQNAKGGKSELTISIPVATTDDRMELPNGISLILSELLGGEKAVDPASLAERVAELEKELKASKVA